MTKESAHRLEGILAAFLCALLLMGSLAFMPMGAKAFPDTATFQGYVTDGGSPVANAYVKTMLMLGDGEEINMTFTDPSGFYSMGVPGGLQYVVFVAEDSYEMNMVFASIAPGETKWLNFTMTPITEPTDVLLMGYVHDELGNPRSDGIVLGAAAAPGGNGAPYYANITAPDAAGYYEVNITAAPYGGGAIAMDFPGYPMAENMTDNPLASGMSYWFNITLQPRIFNDTGTLSGVITDIDTSAPLENVIITVEVEQGMDDRYSNLTITDSSGMYSMGIRDGYARITIQKLGYSMKMYDSTMLNPGPNVLDAELKQTEAKIRGNVTDLSSMTPIQNAYVILSDQQGNMSVAYTNESGYYELDAFVGTDLVVAAQQEDYSQDYVITNVSSGDELWFDFGLWPASAWLVGAVTEGGTGNPIEWANIHLTGPRFETWANVEPGGHYNVTLVADNYTVEAWASDCWPFIAYDVQVVDGVETVFDIVMTPFENANLTGNVTDQFTGAPIMGAQVSVSVWYYSNGTMTDSEGNYSMFVPGGDLDIWVNAPSYHSFAGTVHVDNYSDTVFNIALMPQNPPTTVLLKGNVTESGSGLPVPWATVRVHFADRSYQNQTTANETGYYEIYVPPWAIEVTAWGWGHGPTFASTNVSGMPEYVLDLQLPTDAMGPQLLSFSESPDQNISTLNPSMINIVIDEEYLREMNLNILREWNSTGTHSNYTVMQGWGTSYDPLNQRNELNPMIMGTIYTINLMWDTSGTVAVLSNSTDSFSLPCYLNWDGSRFFVMMRCYYSNSTVTDVPGTALFDYDTHALILIWTDYGYQIEMPDPSGVLKVVATIIEFSGASPISYENRVVAEMPVGDLSCTFTGVASSGNYKTMLYVSDWSNGNLYLIDTVVDNTAPTAIAGLDQNVIENTNVTLDATSSSDNWWISSYTWSYVDAYGVPVNLTGDVVTCTFNATGSYDVMLTVADGAGWTDTNWVTITVGPDMPPTAVAGNDIWAEEDVSVSFDGSGSSDDVGIANYTWIIAELSLEMYDATPSFTFSTPGVYNVGLVVTDTIGQSSAVDALAVTVNDTTIPTANAGPPQWVNDGTSVELNGSGSSDNVGIVNYTWSFTDVAYTELYGMVVSHTFSAPGTYSVTLTVADAAGLTGSDSVFIVVNGHPVADAGVDQLVNVGATVTFDGSGTHDDLDSLAQLNLTWTFTYNSAIIYVYGTGPSYTFAIAGQYVVTLNVTDTMGLSDTDTMTVTVNAPPSANAGPDQAVNEGATVTFNGASSTDDLDLLAQLNLTWTFTYDGSPRTIWGQAPTFQFVEPGAYVVTLTVTDTNGLGDTDTMTVTVNEAPVADAGSDQLVDSGDMVTFDATASTDDIDSLATLNFTWNFTYDGSPVVLYGSAPSFTFVEGGAYNVWLTIRDSGGLDDVDYVDITVNLAPVARAGADQDVNTGATVTFNASATTDDMDSSAALNYTWTFTYSGVLRNLWGLEVSYVFVDPSSYIVTLTVTDSNGLSSTDTLLVNVNGPPTANAGPDETVAAGDTVELDGSMSADDGGSGALNYTWNFTASGSMVTLYDVHPTHIFSSAGAYIVTLTVRDAGGLTSTDTMTVIVTAANAAPFADAGDDQTRKVGDVVVFDGGDSTDDAATTGLNYTWEFVYEGRTTKLYGPQPTFEFAEDGTYTVTLTVRDAGGLTSTDDVVITVEKEAKSFISQYWWSLALIVVAAVALVALLLMRKKGSGGSKAEDESEAEVQEKEPPPPDEEEL